MNQNLLSRVLEFLRRKMWNKQWRTAVTCLAAVVVFGVTYALVLPAITMTGRYPVLSAEALSAWTGDEMTVKVSAEADEADNGKIVVLTLEGEGADLSASYAFDEEGVCVIKDEAEKEIELHRAVREDVKNTVDYWFTLEPGDQTVFTLNLADEVDETRFAETMEAVRLSSDQTEAGKASVSDAGKSAAVAEANTEKKDATASNAEQASASNADIAEANSVAAEKNEEKIITEADDNGFVEILDGAIVNDLEDDDEEEEATEIIAELKVSAGIASDYEEAVKDAEKNADKRGNAQLKFQWKDVVVRKAAAPDLASHVNGATIAVFCDEKSGIPADAVLSVEEILEGSAEYDEYLSRSRNAVASGSNARKLVNTARFFDIGIYDADGNEVRPETPVKVVATMDEGIEIVEDDGLRVIRFDEDGALKLLASGKVAGGQSVEGLSFTAETFSVYGIVGTETMKGGELTAEGSFGNFTVQYDENAGIPSGAALNVSEIGSETGRYQAYMEKAGSVLLEERKASGISRARFYDISITKENVRLEPQTPVEFTVSYEGGQELGAGTDVSVLALGDPGADILEANVETDGTMLKDVRFRAGRISTFGIVGTRGSKNRKLTAEGDGFTMTVTYGEEAAIPAGAELRTEVIADEAEKAAEYTKAIAEATHSKAEDLTFVKLLSAEITDAEGKKIQPAAPVDVEFELADKKNEFETLAFFFGEGEEPEIITPQAEDEKVSLEAAQISDCAIVETKTPKATKITGKASDGATVEITGRLPEGAEAKIVPVTLTKEQLVEYYGESLVKAVDNLVVYDICIMVDGQEWEPDDSVSVVINNPKIDTKTNSNEEIAVTHIDNEKKSVEKMETVVTEDGGVSFDTKSFSLWGLYTYTVDFYLDNKEYHMPGNTSMLLSELFTALQSSINVQDVAGVTFTNETLLRIDQEGADWRLVSLLPFDTDELLTITMADGSAFTILTQDMIYPKYTYDKEKLTPYAGSFKYIGHYDIFGGGNGISSVVKEQDPSWWKGKWGGNSYWNRDDKPKVGGVTADLPMLKGKAVGRDHEGNLLKGVPGKYLSGSSAEIEWNGEVERAFLSIGWHRGQYKTDGHLKFTIYGPGGGHTEVEIPHTNIFENDSREPVNETTTREWRILSFDAKNFVNQQGQGKYTVVLELEPAKGETRIRDAIQDMGFSIYGVTADSTANAAAIAGIVDEKIIARNRPNVPNADAVAEFYGPITPRGNGKAWFNCQGGETHSGDIDIDYLEIMKADGTYLFLGEGNYDGKEGDIPIPGWQYYDIAKPNDNQTAPDGYTKFQNCFSFGLTSFTGLEGKGEMSGVRKRMKRGDDCFGSIMLLVEIMPAEGTVEAEKGLSFDGNGIIAELPPSDKKRTFTFHVEPVEGAPVPRKPDGTENLDYSVTFSQGMKDGEKAKFEMGTFKFGNLGEGGPWTFKYDVTETSTSGAPWICDSRALRLTFTVRLNEAQHVYYVDSYEWTVKDNPADERNYFINNYTLPVALKVEKKGIDGKPVSGATFCLYSDENCTQVADVYTDAEKSSPLKDRGGIVTGNDGYAYFYGVNKGTESAPAAYYLKEINAPDGYVLDDTVIAVNYNKTDNKWYYTPSGGAAIVLPGSVSNDMGTLTIVRVNLKEIYVKKVDKDSNAIIPGVIFALTRSDTADGPYTAYVESGHTAGDNKYTTGSDGTFAMKLPKGYYKLKEKKTAAGYIIDNDCEIAFQVADQGDKQVIFTNTDFAVYDGDKFTFTAKNTRGQSLPNTGGPGTLIYTLSGITLFIGSALMYGFRLRRGERGFN